MSKKHSEIFKLDTIHQYKAGISTTQLCKQVGIARSTLLLWVKQYSVNADGEVPRERYLLEKELEHLRTENAIFKTCGCSLSSPLSERLSAIPEPASYVFFYAFFNLRKLLYIIAIVPISGLVF